MDAALIQPADVKSLHVVTAVQQIQPADVSFQLATAVAVQLQLAAVKSLLVTLVPTLATAAVEPRSAVDCFPSCSSERATAVTQSSATADVQQHLATAATAELL